MRRLGKIIEGAAWIAASFYVGVALYGNVIRPALGLTRADPCVIECQLDKIHDRLDLIEQKVNALQDAVKRDRIDYFPQPPTQKGI